MRTHFDAVIIGGGPAGAMTALRLAKLGWSAALIERRARGWAKTCGHCLNPRGLGVLQRNGLLSDVLGQAVGQTRTLRVHLPNDRHLESVLTPDAVKSCDGGILIERTSFDQLLIDRAVAAGAEVLQPASARLVSSNDDATEIDVTSESRHLRLQSPLVIGADGVGSTVARASGLADPSSAGRKYGFSFDVPRRSAGIIKSSAIEMFVAPGGYIGVVQQDSGNLHLAAIVSSEVAQGKRDPMDFVHSVAAHHDSLRRLGFDTLDRNEIDNFTAIGPMPWRPRSIADARMALVGDAAGYVEPFTGEGMSWAIQSADVLGDVLANIAPGAWNRRVARHYASAWKRRIGRSQRVCRFMAFTLARPRMSSMVFQTGAHFPRLTRRFVQQVMVS